MTKIEELKIKNYDLIVKQMRLQDYLSKIGNSIQKNFNQISKLENEDTQTDKDPNRVNDT